jgi:hypothetical protein
MSCGSTMAGLLFVVCIPTSKQELNLNEGSQGKSASSDTINEDCIQQFSDRKPESLQNLRKAISTADSLYETDGTSISNVSKTPKGSTATISSDITVGRNDERKTPADNNRDRSSAIAVNIEEPRRKEELTKVNPKKNVSERAKGQDGVMAMEKVSTSS